MQKNLSKNIIKPAKTEKNNNSLLLITYISFSLLISWSGQFYAFSEVNKGHSLSILLSLLLSSWGPFFIALILLIIYRVPSHLLCFVPKINKKIFWAIVTPLLVSAIGLQFSINFSQIFYQSSDAPLFLVGNSVFSALHLFLAKPAAIIIFTCIFALGLEVQFRGFLLELLQQQKLQNAWFYSGIIQFVSFFPFIWFGYFGGSANNIFYTLLFALVFISHSGFLFWLSTFSSFVNKNQMNINNKRETERSLLMPMVSSCIFYTIYFFVTVKFFVENGNMWMSGPANGITVMIQSIITIFLLMTKRLKY